MQLLKRRAEHALDLSTRATELLDTLLDQMSRDFPTAAIFLVSSSAFKGWRGRGLGSVTDIGSLVIPRTLNSLLSLSGRGVTGGMASGAFRVEESWLIG